LTASAHWEYIGPPITSAWDQDIHSMPKASSRIDPHDTLLLFVDLQAGIFELSQTISLDRLKKGVLGLAQLAKVFGTPAIILGVAGEDGIAPRMGAGNT
jgi:hypothetical protein